MLRGGRPEAHCSPAAPIRRGCRLSVKVHAAMSLTSTPGVSVFQLKRSRSECVDCFRGSLAKLHTTFFIWGEMYRAGNSTVSLKLESLQPAVQRHCSRANRPCSQLRRGMQWVGESGHDHIAFRSLTCHLSPRSRTGSRLRGCALLHAHWFETLDRLLRSSDPVEP